MHIHNDQAIKRDITFKTDVRVREHINASEQCCWNCRQSVMTYDGMLWCDGEMDEVDYRDMCSSWRQRQELNH